ncbi:MAG: hypothetical protein KatS3mg110_4275 [Pirellulaceae bacterium]|nr:MAG: hypothetical protein KatS3mg110_4275 [Pirellulaceae bacterium]
MPEEEFVLLVLVNTSRGRVQAWWQRGHPAITPITRQPLNKLANLQDRCFSDAVLLVCPTLTIREHRTSRAAEPQRTFGATVVLAHGWAGVFAGGRTIAGMVKAKTNSDLTRGIITTFLQQFKKTDRP